LDAGTDIVLVVFGGRQVEAATRLARIGLDRVVGYLADLDQMLIREADRAQRARRLTVYEFAKLCGNRNAQLPVVIDVRTPNERATGHLPDQLHIPLAELRRRTDEIPKDRPVVVYCTNGWRSSVAASVLRRSGRADVADLFGGYTGWLTIHRAAHA
jgi:rhodanese-related sulfurtransferase